MELVSGLATTTGKTTVFATDTELILKTGLTCFV